MAAAMVDVIIIVCSLNLAVAFFAAAFLRLTPGREDHYTARGAIRRPWTC